ncbi:hypothetical protein CF328_g7446 [Tilletia controversa]|nr:hypothetical protein CF328_g7446 [Tilletia controversa]
MRVEGVPRSSQVHGGSPCRRHHQEDVCHHQRLAFIEKVENESATDTTWAHAASPSALITTSASSAEAPAAPSPDALSLRAHHLPRALRLEPKAWLELLSKYDLLGKYGKIVPALQEGLDIGIKPPANTYIAKHHQSALLLPDEVKKIFSKELAAGRYAGPFDSFALKRIVGDNYQTSPLGLRLKANGKYRPIQDFSHGSNSCPSVNSTLRPDDWPTTWCSFHEICRILLMHPRTSQAYVRGVTSAFRQVPLHPSQWASTVVEWDGQFYVDLFLDFGLGPACGAYGLFADAYADIIRAAGIATTAHWVDDNVFLRVPKGELELLNTKRGKLRQFLDPTPKHSGGRTYWTSADGTEYTENYEHSVCPQPHSQDGYHMGLQDIDDISSKLGWPWKPEKDAPWASTFRYAGIIYNIATREVSLPESKRTKYLATIAEIRENARQHEGRYKVQDIERLHGQCQWATHIHEEGKWHVRAFQTFLRTAPIDPSARYQWRRGSPDIKTDLDWWETALLQSDYWRSFDPKPPVDLDCYCDGSTLFGVALSIKGRERAYPLRQEFAAKSDIKTIEALALELAVLTLVAMGYRNQRVLVHTENTAVFGAFKKGRMAADEANQVLERVARHESEARLSIQLKWVDTHSQRADAPSRGKSSSTLPCLPIPTMAPELRRWFQTSWKWEVLLDQQKERLSAQKATKSTAETTAAATSTSSEQVKTHHHPDEPVADTIRDSTISKPPLPTPAVSFTLPKAKTESITTRRFNPNTIVVKPTANRPDQIPGDLRFELIEEDRRSPAKPELVELWIAEAAGIKSGGYLKDWVCGLKAWHTLNGVPWLDDDRMRLVKRGAKYTQPPPKPPRAPMTEEWLRQVLPAAKLDDPLELAVAATATCGVWGLFRLGELVVGDEPFHPSRNVTRADITTEMVGAILTATVKIPRTKTQHHGESVVLVSQPRPADPIGLLTLHTMRNPATQPAQTPLFAYRKGNDLVSLTKDTFLTKIAEIARRVGATDIHGHSMRIGGCTTLLKRGMAPDKVMLHGRWNSSTWKRRRMSASDEPVSLTT